MRRGGVVVAVTTGRTAVRRPRPRRRTWSPTAPGRDRDDRRRCRQRYTGDGTRGGVAGRLVELHLFDSDVVCTRPVSRMARSSPQMQGLCDAIQAAPDMRDAGDPGIGESLAALVQSCVVDKLPTYGSS